MDVSPYHYICVLIPINMRQCGLELRRRLIPQCVRIPLYMCPHTSIYVSSCHYMCPHTAKYVPVRTRIAQTPHTSMYPHTTIYVSSYLHIRVLMPQYMCSHTAKYVPVRTRIAETPECRGVKRYSRSRCARTQRYSVYYSVYLLCGVSGICDHFCCTCTNLDARSLLLSFYLLR
jgi:hypothetical protein